MLQIMWSWLKKKENAIPQGMLDSFTEETLKISVLPNS